MGMVMMKPGREDLTTHPGCDGIEFSEPDILWYVVDYCSWTISIYIISVSLMFRLIILEELEKNSI